MTQNSVHGEILVKDYSGWLSECGAENLKIEFVFQRSTKQSGAR